MFIKDEAQVASRVGGIERGVLDFGELFGESDEQEFRYGLVSVCLCLSVTRQSKTWPPNSGA